MPLTSRDTRFISKEIARLDPPGYFLVPCDPAPGHVCLKAALPGTDARTAPLIHRVRVRDAADARAVYLAINTYLASRPDWGGIESADRGEGTPVTLDDLEGLNG